MKKFAFILFVICAACGPSTHITGSWKNTSSPAKRYNGIIVTAITQNLPARQTVETDLATALNAGGIRAIKSIDVLPPGFLDEREINKEELLNKIRKTASEGILTVALINRETENRYVPGSYGYTPITRYGYYGRFSGYYTTWYPTIYSPGYYEQDKVYFIEINFYDAATEDLIWSAQSETYNPAGLPQFSKEFTKVVLNKMRQDGVI